MTEVEAIHTIITHAFSECFIQTQLLSAASARGEIPFPFYEQLSTESSITIFHAQKGLVLLILPTAFPMQYCFRV
jgi:hypothetical protein